MHLIHINLPIGLEIIKLIVFFFFFCAFRSRLFGKMYVGYFVLCKMHITVMQFFLLLLYSSFSHGFLFLVFQKLS